MIRATRTTGGFTLLEIILAMGVLMFGSLGALVVYRIAVGSHHAAEDQSAAALAAEGLLADFEVFCTEDNLKQRAAGDYLTADTPIEMADQQCANFPQFYYDVTFAPPESQSIGQSAELFVTLRLKHYPDAEFPAGDERRDPGAYVFRTVFLLKPL